MRIIIFICLVFISCGESNLEKPIEDATDEVVESIDSTRIKLKLLTEKAFDSIGLVDIKSINKNILIELRYASENNFMHIILYDTLQECYLQREVAVRLSKCQHYLDSIHPGFHLKVFDGVRPLQVQREMWNALDSIPRSRRGKFVSNPNNGSVHNFGAAVDLTIVDDDGNELDMGAGYDDFREIAFPKLEQQFLKSGELTKLQVENRKLLRKVMAAQGFRNIPSEWWHFNAYSRITTSHKFQMLVSESGSTKWFRIIPKIDSLEVEDIDLTN